MVSYCSQECHLANWHDHKRTCTRGMLAKDAFRYDAIAGRVFAAQAIHKTTRIIETNKWVVALSEEPTSNRRFEVALSAGLTRARIPSLGVATSWHSWRLAFDAAAGNRGVPRWFEHIQPSPGSMAAICADGVDAFIARECEHWVGMGNGPRLQLAVDRLANRSWHPEDDLDTVVVSKTGALARSNLEWLTHNAFVDVLPRSSLHWNVCIELCADLSVGEELVVGRNDMWGTRRSV